MVPVVRAKLQIEMKIEGVMTKQENRLHLGSSAIGKECGRALWYGFRWSRKIEWSARMIRLFNRGHMEELVVIEDLINAGCKVNGANLDRTIINRFKTVFNHDLPEIESDHKNYAYGHAGGTKDAVVENLPDAPETPHLLEVKTSNSKGFFSTKQNGVEKQNYTHFIQMQIYMYLYSLKRALYVMVNKETDERYYERIKYDKAIALKYIERAEQIIKREQPPNRISEDSKYYLCLWCNYKQICFNNETPDRNCRTCNNIGLRDNGVWQCELKSKQLSEEKQNKGCKKYKQLKNFK